ncbi:unnamed protein product, partial [Timema podura]|nr:unnamed protein product [Timema podura]
MRDTLSSSYDEEIVMAAMLMNQRIGKGSGYMTSMRQEKSLGGTKMSTELQDLQKGGSLCDTDPYEELLNALKKRNLQLFHELLNRNDLVEPDHCRIDLRYGDPDFTTCMDLACKNEDCVPFIEALLKHNANPNLVNHKRAPIHVAAEAGNTSAFLALLASRKLDVNKLNDLGDTAFHTAAKKLKAQRGNHDYFIETLLSKSDINVNIASRKNYTGLHWAAKRGCRDTVENILKLKEHDVDSYKTADGKTARETLEEKFPGLEIPQYQPKETSVYDSKTRLFGHLYKRNSDKFITDLQKALESNRDEVLLWHDGSYTFLQYACDKGMSEVVTFLLNEGFDIHYTIEQNTKEAIFLACQNGYHEILNNYLDYTVKCKHHVYFETVEGETVLHAVMIGKKNLGMMSEDGDRNFDKCIHILIENLELWDIDINAIDRQKYTALHYAAKFDDDDTVMNLLVHGAYIGTRNVFKEPPLANISPHTLETFLDSCMDKSSNYPREDSFEIEFDFQCLEPPTYKVNSNCEVTVVHVEEETHNEDSGLKPETDPLEVFQFAVSPKRYVRSPENYLEIIMLIVVGVIIFKDEERDTIRQHISAIAILLSWAELVLLIGRHPLLSTNIEMLKRVSWNFLKFLAWYSILIVAFALSFYTLFRGCQSSDCGDDDENFFLNPGMSVLKTVVMLTVLFNLLNGLAVSDTQAIKDDAEIVGYVSRVQLIYYFETILLGNPLACVSPIARYCCCLPFLKCLSLKAGLFRSIFLKVCLFPYILPGKKIYVLPNQDCRVVTDQPGLRKKHKNYFYESNHRHRGTGEYNTICFLDQEISKEACNILANRGKKSEVTALRKTLGANVTGMRFFTRMNVHVDLKCLAISEHFRTQRAMVRLLLAVDLE